MSKAIETVEKLSGGKSFKATLRERDSIYLYIIETINDNGVATYIVDPLTGISFKQINNLMRHDDGHES